MNSVMQALLHTPPLADAMLAQTAKTLLGPYGVPRTAKQAARAADTFNSVVALRDFFERAWQPRGGARTTTPTQFINNLRKIARPLRPGRQEDAHEYLRFLLESMQQACVRYAPERTKPNDPLLATTFVQRMFGGRLRSRVTCHHCKHDSDTFDPFQDLSLDVRKGIGSVKQALDAFTMPEALSGTPKYRCDSCKRRVDATKRFTIDAAPTVLTVHLKRFGIFGNKINAPVSFGESLHLGKYMSERHKAAPAGVAGDAAYDAAVSTAGAAQQYKLFAVIHHFGSGPNVGHYVASVRAPDGQWLRMDDSYVSRMAQSPAGDASAYILFYVRENVALDALAHAKPRAVTERRTSVTKPASAALSPSKSAKRKASLDTLGNGFGDGLGDELGAPLKRDAYESLVQGVPADDSMDDANPARASPSPKSDKAARKEHVKRKKRRAEQGRWSPSRVRPAMPPW